MPSPKTPATERWTSAEPFWAVRGATAGMGVGWALPDCQRLPPRPGHGRSGAGGTQTPSRSTTAQTGGGPSWPQAGRGRSLWTGLY